MLAPPEVASLGIFGTGVQAQGHIDAMLSARSSIETIFVSGRTLESTTNFVETANSQGRKILAATPEQAAECDVICGCTSATTPVIPTESVRNGAHINLVGSYSAARREVDTDLITKSSVFVDEGRTMKRLRPRAKGRADRIFKRSCHITLMVSNK